MAGEAAPKVVPVLDPRFRPAVLANRAFRAGARATGQPVKVRFALEQADGSVFHHRNEVFPEEPSHAAANFTHVERLVEIHAVVAGRLSDLPRRAGVAGRIVAAPFSRDGDRPV